jgi:hypothetical protein
LETPWRRWTKCGKRWKSLGWTSGSQKKYLSIEILWVNRLVVSLPEKIVTVSLFRAWSKRRPEKIVSWDHHPRMEKSTYFEPPTSKIDINILIPGVTSRKYSSTCVWDIHGVNMYTYIYIYIYRVGKLFVAPFSPLNTDTVGKTIINYPQFHHK